MTSKLTILSIDPEAAGEDVRRMQEALCLLEQLRQLLKNIGSRDLADLAAHAAGEGSGAVWLAAAAAKLLDQVPTHEEWACRERIAIDRHIAGGKRRVRELTERLGSLPGSR